MSRTQNVATCSRPDRPSPSIHYPITTLYCLISFTVVLILAVV
jgi:hypothetical protein